MNFNTSIQNTISLFLLLLISGCKEKKQHNFSHPKKNSLPNIVVIYADDLGYGDLSCYGAKNIKTPNIDALAKEGIKFNNAYSTAATCTPSRYSLLTGQYAWKKKGTSVAKGDQSLIIDTTLTTLPSMLQNAGYRTAVVGKWHLGLGGKEGPKWNDKITPGPLEIGFDYSYLIPATGDRVPCVFVENHHVVDLDPNDPIKVSYTKKIGNWPTGKENPELLSMKPSQGHNNTIVNGISRIGFMEGGKTALWNDEYIAERLVTKSTDFIESSKEKPFFLFLSTHDIHVPRVAHKNFKGKSNMGPRGDVILQLDWTVKKIIDALDNNELLQNTIIVFSSDNGPVLDDGYQDQARELIGNHQPTGGLRGGKYSSYEGGTKIPLLIRWPNGNAKGTTSDALFSQVDFLNSFKVLVGGNIPSGQAPDSQNMLSVLMGKNHKGRASLVQESYQGPLSYIEGSWKYIAPLDGPQMVPWGPKIETGFYNESQLYNIKEDPNEQHNLANQYPKKTKEFEKKLSTIKKGTFSNIHEVDAL